MSTAAKPDGLPRVRAVEIGNETITAHLDDGRTISVPLSWSWRLTAATPEQRANYRVVGDGEGIYWPDIDEDISVSGMLTGSPAPRRRTND